MGFTVTAVYLHVNNTFPYICMYNTSGADDFEIANLFPDKNTEQFYNWIKVNILQTD